MKKITIALSLLCSITLFSQNTYVPDDNFEQALIDLGYDSGALDNYVPTNNIVNVGYLDINNKLIDDLTGIEDFIGLYYLSCIGNNLNSIDLRNNVLLQEFYCNGNQIAVLDLSQNVVLNKFLARNNQLTFINIKNGNNSNLPGSYFDVENNPNLTCIEVDNLAYSVTNWSNIDAQSYFSIDCGFTYVPDDNFEQALIDLGYDSGALDNHVATDNIDFITNLNISNKSISDLTGIENFNSLQILNCNDNNLNSFDITQNTALTSLRCSTNNLASLDISQNINLGILIFGQNSLTSLDITQNMALHTLVFTDNQLTNIDVTQHTQLATLSFNNNDIIGLDVSQNPLLEELYCNSNQLAYLNLKNGTNGDMSIFTATNNPNLTCIEVDDASYSTTNWTDIDAQSYFSADCGLTYIPDSNFEQALIDLGYDSAPLDSSVPTASINAIVSLTISNKNIANLTGIKDFVSLTNLICFGNQLTSLDISQNTALTSLRCFDNQLTSFDATQNTALEELICGDNQLTSLDVTQNLALNHLSFGSNQLTSIDVTQNAALVNLICDDNSLTSLDVTQNTLFERLHCFENPLTSLDVTQNLALTDLSCKDNQLATLDVTQNLALTDLSCGNNQLTNLDLSLHTNLKYLWARNNQLISLNVSNGNNINFTIFNCNLNPSLTCVQVDDATWSTANWNFIDATASFSENCGLSVDEYNLLDIAIYPNPTSGLLYIKSETTIVAIEIYNQLGQLIIGNSNQDSIDISKLNQGIYFCKIEDKNGNFGRKRIVKN